MQRRRIGAALAVAALLCVGLASHMARRVSQDATELLVVHGLTSPCTDMMVGCGVGGYPGNLGGGASYTVTRTVEKQEQHSGVTSSQLRALIRQLDSDISEQ